MKHYAHLAELQALVGQEIGYSDWLVVDQERIDLFARATGDHQWIHTDPERAAAGPFGATVAHGFLTLEPAAGAVRGPVSPSTTCAWASTTA